MNERRGILVVDDTVSALKLLVSTLAAEGYESRPCNSGATALSSVLAEPPELVLLDVRMPGMDGFEVCRQLKVDESTRDIPVLFLSATIDPEERVKGFSVGAVDFISKPFQRDELLARVRTHLELSRLRSKLESQVAARTEELRAANEQLRTELAERKRAEAALRVSEEKFSKAFQSSPTIMVINSLETERFLDVNKAFELCTGFSKAEVIGRTISELSLLTDLGLLDWTRNKLQCDGGYYDLEFQFRTKSGEERSGRMSAERIEFNGESCLLAVAEDITERSFLEQQLRQAQKMEAVGRLAGGVAHDFNNILCAILMGLGHLRTSHVSREALENGLKEMEDEAKRAVSLTRQLLLFSRRQRADTKPTDLNQIVRQMLAMLRRLMGEDIQLSFETGDSSLCVNADTGMMEQVLMNLCINARDAMPNGGRLDIATRRAIIETPGGVRNPNARPGVFACLSVTDYGCGMDEATLKRIFEPFFTTKEEGKGTGLGLATVFGIVKQHQGWIHVESAPGKGSIFSIYMPIIESVRSAQSVVREDSAEIQGGSETVLVVEDDHAVRRTIVLGLRKLGYAVLEAADANHAIRIWGEFRDKIDLLLTDLVMPGGLSGIDLANRLRAEKRSLRIIISSGYAAIMSNPDLLASQGVVALAKPYDAAVLARAVRSCLDQVAPSPFVPLA
jgi:PAS domain S-box-containing protein